MAFGDHLFRLAQGIIANEQNRKRLELQEQQMEAERKQAERTFALRKQEVEARQGFLELQTKQLENKIEMQTDPHTIKMRELEIQFQEARIAEMKARTAETLKGEKGAASLTQEMALGREKQRLDTMAKESRTDTAINNILNSDNAGLDEAGLGIKSSLQEAGVRTWKDLEGAIEHARKDVRSKESDKAIQILDKSVIEKARTRRDNLIKAKFELRKVYDLPVTPAEFERVSPHSASLNQTMFENALPFEAHKLNIWGNALINQNATQALDVAIKRLRDTGDEELLTNFIKTRPGNLLDDDGRLTDQGALSLGNMMMSEGVPAKNFQNFATNFNSR